MSRGLVFTTRPISGREGKNVIQHMSVARSLVDTVDILSSQRSDAGLKYIREHGSFNPSARFSPYALQYDELVVTKKTWAEVYADLPIEEFRKYDQLFIIGGVDLWRSGLERNGKRVGVFPRDKGQLKFRSTGTVLLNLLAMLKAHRELGIPLHEVAHDPNEMSLDLVHPDFAPKENYRLYFGYDIPRYNMARVDSMQHHLERVNTLFKNTAPLKKYDLTFGYTVLSGSERSPYVRYVNDVVDNFLTTNIFVKNDQTGVNTLKDRSVYMDYISKSRYTIILPSYDKTCFSVFRMIESLHNNCLPLLHPDCNIDEVGKSFGVDLSPLIRTTEVDDWAETVLHFKKAFTQHDVGFRVLHGR